MTNDAPHHLAVLLILRVVEAVLFADALFDGGWQAFLTGVEATGRQFDEAPCDCNHNEDGRNCDQESSDYEAKHCVACELLVRHAWHSVIPLRRITFDVNELPREERTSVRIHALHVRFFHPVDGRG